MELPEDWPLSLEQEISQVLSMNWDPLCITSGGVSYYGGYQKYVAPIAEILTGARSEDALVKLLHEAKIRDFGIIDFPRHRNRVAARKLLQIRISGNESQSS